MECNESCPASCIGIEMKSRRGLLIAIALAVMAGTFSLAGRRRNAVHHHREDPGRRQGADRCGGFGRNATAIGWPRPPTLLTAAATCDSRWSTSPPGPPATTARSRPADGRVHAQGPAGAGATGNRLHRAIPVAAGRQAHRRSERAVLPLCPDPRMGPAGQRARAAGNTWFTSWGITSGPPIRPTRNR